MCRIVPTGVFIASITESGMLCVLLINSTSKYFPNLIFCPCVTSINVELLKILCSSNLFLINPIASFGAYTGISICFNKYGTLPIWSSCPCVIIRPFIFSSFLFKYVISGITKSTPNISSSGNDKPQSTTIISSSYSKTVIFFPTSCSPPSGIIFSFGFLNIFSCFFVVFLSTIAFSPLTTKSFGSVFSFILFSLFSLGFLVFLDDVFLVFLLDFSTSLFFSFTSDFATVFALSFNFVSAFVVLLVVLFVLLVFLSAFSSWLFNFSCVIFSSPFLLILWF